MLNKSLRKNPLRRVNIYFLLGVFLLAQSLAFHQPIYGIFESPLDKEEVYIINGDLETLKVYSLTRVAVGDPGVADIVDAKSNELIIIAKRPGMTPLFIWDKYGKRTVFVRVFEQDLELTQARLERLLEDAGIKGVQLSLNPMEGRVVLSGEIPSNQAEVFAQLLEPFEGSLLSLVKEEPVEDLVQIDVQIFELNTSLSKALGFDWSTSLDYKETLPSFNEFKDLFKIGDFSRTTAIINKVNFLITEGKGRVLSKPKLVVVSGKEASFLVGGEIPIRTTTIATTGTATENVEFKDFGVSLNIVPTITPEDKVEINLNVEVSDIDPANATARDVAFTVRNAKTILVLENNQTVVLAGLIKQNQGETVSRLPLLGSLPVVGLLFRSKKSPVANTETELVVSLTPTILKQRKQATAKAPGSSTEALIPSETMETYLRDLQERISEAVTYPPEMEDRGAEGIVDLSLHLREDGRLKDASIVRSSGYDGFDKDALNTAKRLSPYPAFPQPGLKEYTATIPVIYRKPQTSRSIIPQQMKYLEEIQQKIATSVIYPQEAKEFGWEGTVKVALHILNDGTLVYASIRESSGYDLLDEDALKTVKMLAPYSVFPSGLNLQELNVTVPIVYSSIEK